MYTVPPPCGGVFIGNGTIQSPGFPSNYSNNQVCNYLLLTSTYKMRRGTYDVIQLSFEFFLIEEINDFLEIKVGKCISTYINTKKFVCVCVFSRFSRPFRNQLGHPLPYSSFLKLGWI